MIKMTDKQLVKFCSAFRSGLIGTKPSHSMCFAMCWPMVGLLNTIGVECELNAPKNGQPGHHWIDLPDGRILDPTADQFINPLSGNRMPKIYLGHKPEWYETQLR